MNDTMLQVFTTECANLRRLLEETDIPAQFDRQLADLCGAAHLCNLKHAAYILGTFSEELSSATADRQQTQLILKNLKTVLCRLESLAIPAPGENDPFWGDLEKLLSVASVVAPVNTLNNVQNNIQPALEKTVNITPDISAAKSPLIDDGMWQMFITESRQRLQTLSDNVLLLEQGSDPAATLEELMRAAHSLKGAARIISMQPAAELAHALEDKFVALQKNPAAINAAQADCLLQTVDGLEKLCLHNCPSATEFLDLLQAFDTAAEPGGAGNKDSTPQASSPVTAANIQTGINQQTTAATANAAGNSSTAVESTEPATRNMAQPENEDEKFLRLSARSVSRIMALSGEGVVSARRLEPLGGKLRELQTRHTRILEFYDYLYQQAMQGNFDGSLFADVRRQLEDCQQLMREQSLIFDRASGDFNELSERLYREALSSRMRRFSEGIQGLQRMVRDLSRELNKPVEFRILGLQTRVDRDILSKLEAPLGHLIRNSLDHGLQTATQREQAGKTPKNTLTLQALHWAGFLNVILSDDGRGIDLERVRQKIAEKKLHTAEEVASLQDDEVIEFLFLPGFSTSGEVTEISGRGVGLDVVRSTLQNIGGVVTVENHPGEGVSFRMQLPVTRSVVRVLLVELGGEVYAIALSRIERLMRAAPAEIFCLEGQRYINCDGQNVAINDTAPMLDHPPSSPDNRGRIFIVIVRHNQQLYGLQVGAFLGEKELAQRPLDSRLGKVHNIEAVLPLEDGSLALSLDIDDLITMAQKTSPTPRESGNLSADNNRQESAEYKAQAKILVVDDSPTVREMEKRMLTGAGYAVDTASDGIEGWLRVRSGMYRLIISDIDMPRMSGLQLLQALRTAERFDQTPIMLVSYKDDPQTEEQAKNSGVDYYINKGSFNTGEFLQVVDKLYKTGRNAFAEKRKS